MGMNIYLKGEKESLLNGRSIFAEINPKYYIPPNKNKNKKFELGQLYEIKNIRHFTGDTALFTLDDRELLLHKAIIYDEQGRELLPHKYFAKIKHNQSVEAEELISKISLKKEEIYEVEYAIIGMSYHTIVLKDYSEIDVSEISFTYLDKKGRETSLWDMLIDQFRYPIFGEENHEIIKRIQLLNNNRI